MEKERPAMYFGFLVLGLLFLLLTMGAAQNTGIGMVPTRVEDLGERLEEGVIYHLLSVVKDGDSQIVSVRGGKNARALRIREEEIPPENFVLLDGKIIAVTAQEPPIPDVEQR